MENFVELLVSSGFIFVVIGFLKTIYKTKPNTTRLLAVLISLAFAGVYVFLSTNEEFLKIALQVLAGASILNNIIWKGIKELNKQNEIL